ncbi:alpha/beta hydrolase [Ruminococcaceae bacterium OttesenSCG-928-A16]|nr:alpha/beta hydrolase [Ruminococcaceae bacterium OttesenSCG-928-A16]
MASFVFEGKEIYYESHGEGAPLVVLNGIFMSCASWAAFRPAFAQHNRLILLDLLDQGKTEKMDKEYTQAVQAELLLALLAHLGISKVNLMGISYGGEVAMRFAAAHPAKVEKLVLANTAAYTSKWLKDIGHSWEFAYESHNGHHFFKTCIPIVYSPQFYEENYEWASAREELFVKAFTPEIYDAFGRLTRSAEAHDERQNLGKITAQTLVISSELDFVTPVYQQREIAAAIHKAAHVLIPAAGHAVMYEKPAEFTSIVLGFINSKTNMEVL